MTNNTEFITDRLREPIRMPDEVWSEILPGLWQGGTHDYDTVQKGRTTPVITKNEFDSVYTFYAYANPVSWRVNETRFAFYDGDMTDFKPESDLKHIVRQAHSDWKSGKRVLIRCQAGLNRSGLVMALVLIRDGYNPEEAIALMRDKRSRFAMCNPIFEEWLVEDCVPSVWQD